MLSFSLIVCVFFLQTKRRMLGNIQFIGELYKKAVLKENVMKSCVEKLLAAETEVDADGKLRGLKFLEGAVDETNLEVSLTRSLLCCCYPISTLSGLLVHTTTVEVIVVWLIDQLTGITTVLLPTRFFTVGLLS